MDRVRNRVGDKRVLALVNAFLRARILTEDALDQCGDRRALDRHPTPMPDHAGEFGN